MEATSITILFDRIEMDYERLTKAITQFYGAEEQDFLTLVESAKNNVESLKNVRVGLKARTMKMRAENHRYAISDALFIDAALQRVFEHRFGQGD